MTGYTIRNLFSAFTYQAKRKSRVLMNDGGAGGDRVRFMAPMHIIRMLEMEVTNEGFFPRGGSSNGKGVFWEGYLVEPGYENALVMFHPLYPMTGDEMYMHKEWLSPVWVSTDGEFQKYKIVLLGVLESMDLDTNDEKFKLN